LAGKPTTFAREATGLVREVSPVSIGIWNIASSGPLAIGLAYTLAFWLSNYPRVDLPFVCIVTIALTFCFSGAAALVASAMPRSGGDYVFVGRIIHPAVGFTSSWNMFIYNTITGQGTFVGYIAYYALGPMFYTIGAMLGNPSLIQMGEATLTLPWSFIIILVLVLGYGAILMFGLKTSIRLTVVCVVLGWICLLVGLVSLATISQADFIARFNQYAFAISGKEDAYHYIIDAARGFGYSTETQPYSYAMQDVLGLAGLVSMAVSWNWMHIYFSGEIKRAGEPSRQLLMISIPLVSMLFAYAFSAWLLLQVAGGDFLNAYNYLSVNQPDALPFYVTAGGYVNFLLAMAAPNVFVATIINLSMLFSGLGIMFCFYFTTRILFAWSFDRVMPGWLSDINERLHTPVKATIIFIIMSLIGGIINAFWPELLLPLFAAAGSGSAIFTWIPLCITAIIFPFVRKDIFEAAPLRRLKLGSIPLVSVMGLIGLVYVSYIAYSFWMATTDIGRWTIIAVSAVGFIVFYIAKYYRKSQGIDLGLIFKQIPPE